MSPANIASGTVLWGVNALLALTVGVVGWNVSREYDRNDDQEKRIQAVEKACVKMDYMGDDIREIKGDVKKLMIKGTP